MGPQALAKEQKELMGCQKAPVDPDKVLFIKHFMMGKYLTLMKFLAGL